MGELINNNLQKDELEQRMQGIIRKAQIDNLIKPNTESLEEKSNITTCNNKLKNNKQNSTCHFN